MKKIIRKIFVLVCVAVLFTMPSASVLAASYPVCTIDHSDETFFVRIFTYQPDSLFLASGRTDVLTDVLDGRFNVPAGKSVNFQFFLDANASFSVEVVMLDVGIISNDLVMDSFTYTKTLPAFPEDHEYYVLITAYTDLNLDAYGYYYNK